MAGDDYHALLDYTNSERQREIVTAVIRATTVAEACRALGTTERSVYRTLATIRQRAAHMGYAPAHDMTHPVPEPFKVKGVSTAYNQRGEPVLQWVKTREDIERINALREEAVAALSETIKREKPIKAPKHAIEDLLTQYTVTDYHMGMLAWHEETGADWDTQIAEDLLVGWFAHAIKAAPASSVGVFAQLGDFLHWDGLEALTPQNKHVLDADTRFQKIVRVAIRAIRRIIRMLLQKHELVHIIMAEGNHDPASSIWLREWLYALYEDEPRVTVDLNADPYYCYEFGKTGLFYHHGHLQKQEKIDKVFTAKFRQVFGRTKHCYGHMGHYHHDRVIESELMTVERHRTLASPDAYASRHGFISGRDAKAITYHREHGHVGRIVICPEMVN